MKNSNRVLHPTYHDEHVANNLHGGLSIKVSKGSDYSQKSVSIVSIK
ncbi:hypothetical protein [Virgibacillus dokdonensis]|uniref:Uncharacterized protein n=1 Tax=Virgibacillus dokdonensis TaxID=302167 RepID=A0ABU7VJE6_9BACI